MAYRYRLSRKQSQWLSIIVLLFTLIVWFGQNHGWFNGIQQATETYQPGLYSVTRYVDGDTIEVNMNNRTETIRFIGVDTPETHKPNTPVQCYGPEAAAYTKALIADAGGKVRLSSDPYSTNRDRYDRLLRYIYLPDGTLVEEKLIINGYGFYYPYFPFTKSADFQKAEQQAMMSKAGLWGACRPTPTGDGGYKMNETEPTNLRR